MSDLAINEWSAAQCGVIFHKNVQPSNVQWYIPSDSENGVFGMGKWDFRHPVCMAVIRGNFNIRTNYDTAGLAHSHCADRRGEGIAESPHEADCACLVKIWEASNE